MVVVAVVGRHYVAEPWTFLLYVLDVVPLDAAAKVLPVDRYVGQAEHARIQ